MNTLPLEDQLKDLDELMKKAGFYGELSNNHRELIINELKNLGSSNEIINTLTNSKHNHGRSNVIELDRYK